MAERGWKKRFIGKEWIVSGSGRLPKKDGRGLFGDYLTTADQGIPG